MHSSGDGSALSCGNGARAQKDDKDFRIKLDAVPVSGVIELRVNEPKAANDQSNKIDWPDFSDCEGR